MLRCDALTKSFSGVPVLKGVSLEAHKGAVLGLVGENGAGKSTLMNLIGGIHKPDSGTMALDGHPYHPASPLEAAHKGVAFVHQELNLFTNLSIADNLFLTAYPTQLGLIDRKQARARAADLLKRLNLDVSPDTTVDCLPQGERQLVEIAKALRTEAKLIIFDEPTTSLSPRESERLFTTIDALRSEGIAIIYISHALEDVRRLCNRIAVLRDGQIVGEGSDTPTHELISLMVGRPIEQLYPERRSAQPGPCILRADSLTQPGVLESVSLDLHSGEILGIAGLMGSGRSELARILFGLDPYQRGTITLEDRPLNQGPRERIARGMALVTESRRDDGLFMDAAIAENLEIVHSQPERVAPVAQSLAIKCANLLRQPVKQLSGGNQQKVVLGKWLVQTPRVLILDEPTRGIDVGAKSELYHLIHDLADKGVALLVISSEIEELMGICDRILVMRKGEVRAAFHYPFEREAILGAAV